MSDSGGGEFNCADRSGTHGVDPNLESAPSPLTPLRVAFLSLATFMQAIRAALDRVPTFFMYDGF